MTPSNENVLVTGGSGFVGTHCVLQVPQVGYHANTAVCNPKRAEEINQALRSRDATEAQVNSVAFFTSDLIKDYG
jgi:uncharacterized protein YbjT (DUF2867 family)